MKIKYSVIIPVYNAEKTITRCLDSLVSQLQKNVEIILIDDGSVDNSCLICKKYTSEYSNIIYAYQENQGVSAARNAGLDLAKGKYVVFVDSDDYVSPDYFNTLSYYLEKTHVDLLAFSSIISSDPHVICKTEYYSSDPVQIAAVTDELLVSQMFYPVWDKVFQLDIIKKYRLSFNTEISIGEDLAFVMSYLPKIESICLINDTLYYQDVENYDSLSRKSKDYVFIHLQQAISIAECALDSSPWPAEAIDVLYHSIIYLSYRSVYSAVKELLRNNNLPKQRRNEIINQYCDIINSKRYIVNGWKCRLLAFPIQIKSIGIICSVAFIANFRRYFKWTTYFTSSPD